VIGLPPKALTLEALRKQELPDFQSKHLPLYTVMASRPLKWRILAVFGGLDLDAFEEGLEPSLGALQELTNIAGASPEVNLI
jgi:hypothetical protein